MHRVSSLSHHQVADGEQSLPGGQRRPEPTPGRGLRATLPLQWDIRIVNESAKYGFVFTRRGLIPEQNSLWLLPRLVGMATALEKLRSGIEDRLITTIYNGIDATEFNLQGLNRADCKASAGLAQRKTVIMVARICRQKRQELMVEAAALICRKIPDLMVLFVGQAGPTDQLYANGITRLVRKLGLENNVRFLGFQKRLQELYAASDALVRLGRCPRADGRVVHLYHPRHARLGDVADLLDHLGHRVEIVPPARWAAAVAGPGVAPASSPPCQARSCACS
jgi:glycosyltransferase involved in cell wall biosynthesis